MRPDPPGDATGRVEAGASLQARRGSRYASESWKARVQKNTVAFNHWVRPRRSLSGWGCNRAQRKSRLGPPKLWLLAMECTWLCIGAVCAGIFAGGLLVLVMARLP
jgi:hypothetical protein